MHTRLLAGRTLPVMGQGTWNMELDDRAAAVEALQRGLDLGMTHIDTAEMYGSGRVETLLAEALEGRRDEVFLVSKVLPSNASRQGALRACEASLRRLKTDRLDLYLLHWPGDHPLADTIEAFEELRVAGKIRAWGVSNFDVPELEEAYELGGKALTCNQVLYHLGERAIEARVSPWCAEHGVAVVAYSPLGQGSVPHTEALQTVATRHRATRAQVALAFLTREPHVLAIPKASSVSHVEENATAGELVLSAADIAELDRGHPKRVARGLPTT